jgi:hypothetical protein
MGGFGGGGQQASPPQLSVGQTLQLNQGQIDLLTQNAPTVARELGDISRRESGLNTLFGLNLLADPRETLSAAGRQRARDIRQEALDNIRTNKELTEEERKQRTEQAEAQYQTELAKVTGDDFQPMQDFERAFRTEFGQRDALVNDMKGAKASSSEYNRAQTALGRGVQAQTVGQRTAATSQAGAAGMGDVANVQAGEVGQGAVGQSLMNQALQRANSTGQLSAEASRDATQAARSGMAARGMATGSAGLAAEMLNRDRFARQRQAEDLGFAQGVQAQDLLRQFNNVGNNMQAALANQQTQFGRQQIMSGNQQQANMANMQAANQMAQYNTTLGADTDRYNAGQTDATNRYNLGLLGTSAAMADQERARQLGTQQDIYNFQMQTNPRLLLAGLGSPFANMSQPALSAVSGITGSVNPIYTGGQFSSGGLGSGLMGGGMGALGGALSGAAAGSVIPGVGTAVGAGIGGLVGGLGGFMGGMR